VNIVVLIKEVPDTYGDRALSLETGLADRGAVEAVLDEVDERALEVALAYADEHPETTVTLLTMAPESASATVRKALALGATSAVHVADEALLGADLGLTAEVIGAALRRIGFDLVLAGEKSTDGSAGMLPAMVAELLDAPQLTSVSAVTISDAAVSGTRSTEYGTATVSAALPAVVSVTEALPAARFATFKGIMAAKKKPVETLTAADLGVDPERYDVPRSIVVSVGERPARAAGITIVDDGDAGTRLAEYLIANQLA
jgi:electron transfer flavoprotein beta subunit